MQRWTILVGMVASPELRLKIGNHILVHLEALCENISWYCWLWSKHCISKHCKAANIINILHNLWVISSRLTVFVNGKFCKDPKLATPNDFFFSGLRVPGNTSNKLGSMVTPANVAQIPGLFGSKQAISAYVLTKGFQVDKNVVEYLQSQFWTDNHTY